MKPPAQFEIVNLPETYVKGFAIRTTNAQEQTPEGWIGRTWERVRRQDITHPAAVLFDYENGNKGYFSEIIGEECHQADQLRIGEALTCVPAARYAKFTMHGTMPGIVIQAWQAVWTSEEERVLTRAYTVDFERYPAADVVELYIAVT